MTGKTFAIDPGPHTAIFWMDHGAQARTLDATSGLIEKPLAHLYVWLDTYVDAPNDIIICESFEFRKDDAQNREYIDYSTGEYVGVVKLFCQLTGTLLVMQSASQAKAFWTNDKLKRVGLASTLKDRHQRDAARHWLHYDSFTQHNTYYLNLLR